MSPGAFAVVAIGLIYSGLAAAFGLLMSVLWPRKDHSRANRMLTLFWRAGLFTVACGLVLGLLGA